MKKTIKSNTSGERENCPESNYIEKNHQKEKYRGCPTS